MSGFRGKTPNGSTNPGSHISVIERVARLESDMHASGLVDRLDLALQTALMPVPLRHPLAEEAGIALSLLPLHRIHPLLSGNKWFKLKYPLLQALSDPVQPLVSFGGPWSNHLHALAWAGQALGLETHGVIGASAAVSTPTLQDLHRFGMHLHFVGREGLRAARRAGFSDGACPAGVRGARVIPEGGFDEWGVLGAASLAVGAFVDGADAFEGIDRVHLACGTGCMLAGLRLGLPSRVRLTGWNTHRGDWLAADVASAFGQLTGSPPGEAAGNWEIQGSPVGKGFGPATPPSAPGDWPEIPCDPVYMPRLLAGVEQHLHRVGAGGGERWLIIHGGGLQGARTVGVETG